QHDGRDDHSDAEPDQLVPKKTRGLILDRGGGNQVPDPDPEEDELQNEHVPVELLQLFVVGAVAMRGKFVLLLALGISVGHSVFLTSFGKFTLSVWGTSCSTPPDASASAFSRRIFASQARFCFSLSIFSYSAIASGPYFTGSSFLR